MFHCCGVWAALMNQRTTPANSNLCNQKGSFLFHKMHFHAIFERSRKSIFFVKLPVLRKHAHLLAVSHFFA